GIYKSTDTGKTWTFAGLRDVGQISTVRVHPSNPDIVFVAALGNPFAPTKDRGVYRSTDGGKTWKNVLFCSDLCGAADLEAQPSSGLYRSEDDGATWSLINGAGNLITRPFYYDTIGVDPTNADVVWIGNEGWYKSVDGGKTFRSSPVPHGDNHDVWINPRN